MYDIEKKEVHFWQEGNTSARHFRRLTGPLTTWVDEKILGKPGCTNDRQSWSIEARASLDRNNISESITDNLSAATKILGSLEKYGFVYSKFSSDIRVDDLASLSILAGKLTPAGEHLYEYVKAGDTQGIQNCIFRALANRTLPSPLEPEYKALLLYHFVSLLAFYWL